MKRRGLCYIERFINVNVAKLTMTERKQSVEILGKTVVTKQGKKLGVVRDIIFETRTGELIQIVLTNPTPYAVGLSLEKAKDSRDLLVSFSAVIAVGDFVVVSEEDLH